jgi:type I restriction enzyme S subunit
MWKERTLGDICDEVGGVIQTGPFGSQLHESDYVDDGVPVVMPTNILDGKIETSGIAYISEDEAVRLQRHKMSIGDIVYGRRGDIGRRGLIGVRENGWLCGTGCLRVSLGNTVIDPTYLYYFLGQPLVVTWIANQAVGATMPNLNTGILRSVTVRYPELPVQCRIASILSAYDDLIEDHTRCIKILEEMAQMLYREWFVNFRFPGHEKVRMVESEFGPIPEGWRVGRLDEAVVLQRGFDLPTAQRTPGPVPIIAATGINGSHNEFKVMGPGVVTGRSGSLGTVMFVWEDFWPLNTTLWVREFRQSTPVHAYFVVKGLDFQKFNSGAAVPTLNRNDVHGLPVVLPERKVLEEFDNHALPLFALQRNLETKNENLRTTRDLLLPKLISGEIPVDAAEEAMEQTA